MSDDIHPYTYGDKLTKLKELLDDIRIASLVTLEGDGTLRSRPMATQEIESDAALWFFTNDYSPKVEDVALHPQVCVSYASPADHRYVSVTGEASLVRDAEKIRQLWKPVLKVWFPKGVDDPDLALIRVDIVSAQYWTGHGNKLVQLFEAAKALATGKSASETMGESGKLTVRPG